MPHPDLCPCCRAPVAPEQRERIGEQPCAAQAALARLIDAWGRANTPDFLDAMDRAREVLKLGSAGLAL
jgi:hypothetical protein